MSKTPAISVVIPLFNKGPYIARALNSVLAQTFQDFEVIIVDDGSSDDGAEIVKEFTDSRIRLIQQENRGVSAARNRGIEVSRAELVAFLDADDEWLPDFLETIMRLRVKYPYAGIYGTAYKTCFPGATICKVFKEADGERLLSSYFGALVEMGSPIFNSSSFAAPKEIINGVGYFLPKARWNEDGTMWGKIALHYPIAYSPNVCSIYHQYSINNSMKIDIYLENPFLQYIYTVPKETLSRYVDIGDLMEYCDYCRLATISRNIYSGYGAIARKELSSIKSPRFNKDKHKLMILSYIPRSGWKLISQNAKTLSYIKWKVIRKRYGHIYG